MRTVERKTELRRPGRQGAGVELEKTFQSAVQQHLAGRWVEAAEIYENLRSAMPEDFRLNHLLGALRQQQGRPAEAYPLLEKACRARPSSAPTQMCLGLALCALGRHTEAEKALLASVALDPKSHETWANLGAVKAVRGAMDQAAACYGRSVEIAPDYAHGWTGLGSALFLAGRAAEAIGCHTRALALDPKSPRARGARAQAWQACQCLEESLADFEAQLALCPGHHESRSFRLYLLNFRDDLSREALFAEHLAYGAAVEAEAGPAAARRRFARRARPDGRLRVAFLSPDLRGHSVAYFFEPLLAHLDRTQFEVILYHDHFSADPVTARLRARADGWRHLIGQAHDVVEQNILADAPDVLIDLAGHTGFNRLELFGRRLAPVQITYLGYPNTTGLSSMDFRLTDAVADPVGEADSLHVEKLVRFAPTAWAYAPPADSPDPAMPPGGPDRPVTFGSFNSLMKLSPATLHLWREVLGAVPGSRLLIKSHGLDAARWQRRLKEAGIATDRVELRHSVAGTAAHLACYSEIDVALDPHPYNGTTTTCEALWMGVPVVSLCGDRHGSRVGASLLAAVGHPEWAVPTPADYVRVAAALARDFNGRRALRSGLRGGMRASMLLDHAGQAARFGAALRACWNERRREFFADEPGAAASLEPAVAVLPA